MTTQLPQQQADLSAGTLRPKAQAARLGLPAGKHAAAIARNLEVLGYG